MDYSLHFVAAEPHVEVERIKRPLDPGVLEELEIGSRAAVAVAHHDVLGHRLEAGAEMLARLDQHVLLTPRMDAAMGEDAEIERLGTLLGDNDLDLAGVEHGGAAHADRRSRGHWPGDDELAV